MDPVLHVGVNAVARLQSLDLAPRDLHRPLEAAAAEARLCTDMDSPGMAGYVFWSRTNRFFRERQERHGWTYSNSQTILRCIHPSRRFAITAVSGSGKVGDEDAAWSGDVRSKNPKGAAVAKLVQRNFEQLPLFSLPGFPVDDQEINAIPTWFLLYKSGEEGLSFELSMPVEMHGKYVDTWQERIILPDNPFAGPQFDIKKLDAVLEGPAVDVPVGFRGAI
ncbi:hypothetical protein [Kitasatospora terrestris]|uniref:Uncharacterized protein n=1 Tax=Kitasatospora terrestris TaxID=258051 RepID=A0ABP9E236_9ACTN